MQTIENRSTETETGAWYAQPGPLRWAFALVIALCLPLVFIAGGNAEGWRLLPDAVIPALVVLFAWVLPFDMLMTKVWMTQYPAEERTRFRRIILFDLVLLLALLLFWGPFFIRILNP